MIGTLIGLFFKGPFLKICNEGEPQFLPKRRNRVTIIDYQKRRNCDIVMRSYSGTISAIFCFYHHHIEMVTPTRCTINSPNSHLN